MVLAAAQRDELIITKRDLEVAINIITSLEDDMLVVFQSIGVSETSRYLTEILAYLRVLKKLDKQTLWRECFPIMSAPQFNEALDGGIKAGFIKMVNHGGTDGDICYITEDGLALTKKKSTKPEQEPDDAE